MALKILLAAVIGLLIVSSARSQSVPTICVVNGQGSGVSDETLADSLPAFQAAIDEDFSRFWTGARLKLCTEQEPGTWLIEVADYTDSFGAAGYHEVRVKPYAIVGVKEGIWWELVFTHELWEMLADPWINRTVYIESKDSFYFLEVADPVESLDFAYSRLSPSGRLVIISDFVTQRWYDGFGSGPLDFTNSVKHVRHVLIDGYVSFYRDGGWHEFDRFIYWKES